MLLKRGEKNILMNKYTPVIGLEIHVELKTQSKMFCQCEGDYFGKKPNSNTCPVCLGMPGALPVPNRTAVEWCIKIGQALGCKINKLSKFDRKHYFYPDLAKAYQISQYDEPFGENGELRGIGITRVHLEEDTGKLTHTGDDTLIDFNRSSVPLVEIVTEPDFDNAEDVKTFLEELHTIIRYLDVSDANMEEGSMRLEPNISLSRVTQNVKRLSLPNYKVEIKNINSFNFAKKAIEFELKRQAVILDRGETPAQETRGYDDKKGITFSQRSKEEAQDYRFFPEPDIPPMEFTDEEIEEIRKTIPELPAERLGRFTKTLELKQDDAFILTRDPHLSKYFEDVLKSLPKVTPQQIANMIINKRIATDISAEEFVKEFNLLSKPVETDVAELTKVITDVLESNQPQVEQFKTGKIGLLGFFVGQVMKGMKGKADPSVVKESIEGKLSN